MADENIENKAPCPGQPLTGARVLRITPFLFIKNQIKIYNSKIRIATWIVRSLYMAGKLADLQKEASRLNIDILGLSEGTNKTVNHVMY